ncbi:ACP phosphodiesterase [Arcobacter sp. LA11]|uniref:acyl carrier protein phosphodiesterase n=1 Tax=Arcobacter sp. LA11 TaxID=1898176 RepID=UPI00093357C0|nr:acyl carrier protein phosphodiesterase [Arcobacter sp. LA11]
MNWLAHIFLSEQNIDFQIGNYLADPLKGRVWEDATIHLKNGVATHKSIDSFTDSHLIVSKSKARLREKGLLKSIIIDITYDYFLTKNWNTFSNISFEKFTHDFYTQANQRLDFLPDNAKESVNRLIKFNILNKYQTIEHLEKAFERFDKRLSKKLASRDTASSYFEAVEKNIIELEKDFMIFFPELCKHVRKNIDNDKIKHWRI